MIEIELCICFALENTCVPVSATELGTVKVLKRPQKLNTIQLSLNFPHFCLIKLMFII